MSNGPVWRALQAEPKERRSRVTFHWGAVLVPEALDVGARVRAHEQFKQVARLNGSTKDVRVGRLVVPSLNLSTSVLKRLVDHQ